MIAGTLAVANAGRDAGDVILFALDAVHGPGVETAGPIELGCDVFISGTHKWLSGPCGTGIVWAHRDVWDRIAAVIPTFSGPSFGDWFDNGNAPFVFGLDGTPGGFTRSSTAGHSPTPSNSTRPSAKTGWRPGPRSSLPA